jgi:hypothetical protein
VESNSLCTSAMDGQLAVQNRGTAIAPIGPDSIDQGCRMFDRSQLYISAALVALVEILTIVTLVANR